jgi:hypothetical protein
LPSAPVILLILSCLGAFAQALLLPGMLFLHSPHFLSIIPNIKLSWVSVVKEWHVVQGRKKKDAMTKYPRLSGLNKKALSSLSS